MMSEDTPNPEEQQLRRQMGLHLRRTTTLQLDWWIAAAFIEEITKRIPPNPEVLAMTTTGDTFRIDFSALISAADGSHQSVGAITLLPSDDGTQVRIQSDDEQFLPYWQSLLDSLGTFVKRSRELRRSEIGSSPDELIETFYRSRAAGSKITLKTIAKQAGISYSWLRQRKMEYDRAGKWGSKTNKITNKE